LPHFLDKTVLDIIQEVFTRTIQHFEFRTPATTDRSSIACSIAKRSGFLPPDGIYGIIISSALRRQAHAGDGGFTLLPQADPGPADGTFYPMTAASCAPKQHSTSGRGPLLSHRQGRVQRLRLHAARKDLLRPRRRPSNTTHSKLEVYIIGKYDEKRRARSSPSSAWKPSSVSTRRVINGDAASLSGRARHRREAHHCFGEPGY